MNAIFPLPPPFEFGPVASEVDPHLRGRLWRYAIQREEEGVVQCELDGDQPVTITSGSLPSLPDSLHETEG